MTVIHLLIGLGGGGAEHFVYELSKRSKLKNIETLVVAITSNNLIKDKFEASNIETFTLDINSPRNFFTGFRAFLCLLRKYNNAVLHAHMFHAVMVACLAKLFLPSLNIVFTLHSNFIKQAYREILLFATKWLRSSDIIFSADSKKWYHKTNSIVIANGIDISRFKLSPELPEIFTCLFLGRLDEEKNPLYLIDLVMKLKDKYKFQINIAGDGSLMSALKKEINLFELENWFNFLGFRKDIPEVLSRSHCMIMPSLWEGLPISILEAGAAGVPIVSTPVGSIPSLLNSGNAFMGNLDEFHLLVENVINNYPDACKKARKLQLLINSDYDIKKSAGAHFVIYKSLAW